MKRIDLVGQRFGRLTVLEQFRSASKTNPQPVTRCTCLCDCGVSVTVAAANLRSGRTLSCGCYSRSLRTTHGFSNHPLYMTWRGINNRCHVPTDPSYKRYGALGITVCDRWRDDFLAFESDMGPRPAPEYSVDRIDPSGPYSPENCRWATPAMQQRNRRNTMFVAIGGETRSVPDWLEIFHVHDTTFYSRLARGMSPFDALVTPVQPHAPRATE